MKKFKKINSKKNFKIKGFSALELLIVVAIIAVMTAVGISAYYNYRNKQNLDLSVREIMNVLRNAQNKSINQENGSAWGVNFVNAVPVGASSDNYYYEIFKGDTYHSGSVIERFFLRPGIILMEPQPSTSSSIVFYPITGYANVAGPLDFFVKVAISGSNNASSTITVNSSGLLDIK